MRKSTFSDQAIQDFIAEETGDTAHGRAPDPFEHAWAIEQQDRLRRPNDYANEVAK